MSAQCPCQHCNGQIGFEAQDTGRSVSCPHCGMETMLFVPLGAVQNQPHGDVFYHEENILVSKSFLNVSGTTYPVGAITSFRIIQLPPDQRTFKRMAGAGLGLILVGFFIMCMSAGEHADSDYSSFGEVVVIGGISVIAFLAVAAVIPNLKKLFTKPPQFALCVTTSAREQIAVTSPSFQTVHNIETALKNAMAIR